MTDRMMLKLKAILSTVTNTHFTIPGINHYFKETFLAIIVDWFSSIQVR